jgi:hypothetical protein
MPDTTTQTGEGTGTGQTTQQTGTTQTTGTTQQGTTQQGTTQQGNTSTQGTATQQTQADPNKSWGDNWRQQYAGEDTKRLAQLERFASPKAVLDSLFAAQEKIRSGDLRAPLPENATPEQVAAYRTQNGIPEKPEGYFEKLPDGLVIGDADKPLFNSFAEGLHKLNAPPQIAQYAVSWYNKLQEEQTAKLAEGDTAAKTATEDELRSEWGADYRANVNHIQGFLAQAPQGVAEMLGNARGGDGKAILNDPNVVRWLASVARDLNPIGTIVGGSGNSGKGIDDEISEIEGFMKTNRNDYNKDEKKQSRYRDLIDARLKQQARGK